MRFANEQLTLEEFEIKKSITAVLVSLSGNKSLWVRKLLGPGSVKEVRPPDLNHVKKLYGTSTFCLL